MYKYILLAVDGSENSLRAAKDAVEIASPETIIELISVIPTEGITNKLTHAGTLKNFENEYRKKIIKEQQYVEANHSNVKVTIEHGSVGRIISNFANKNNADLVVIGCRGLNPMQEMVFGSVSTYVTKNANCSILLVK